MYRAKRGGNGRPVCWPPQPWTKALALSGVALMVSLDLVVIVVGRDAKLGLDRIGAAAVVVGSMVGFDLCGLVSHDLLGVVLRGGALVLHVFLQWEKG